MNAKSGVQMLSTSLSTLRHFVPAYLQRRPFYISFDITYRCNLKCIVCPLWSGSHVVIDKELNTDEICAVIDDACEHLPPVRFRLVGGEPLIRRDVPEIVAYIKQRDMPTEVVTNGVLIDESMAEALVSAGLDHLRISIDAVGDRLDEIRGGRRVWDRIVDGLKLIRSAKERRKANRPLVTFCCTVSRLNLDCWTDVYEASKRFGADFIWYPVLDFHRHGETNAHAGAPAVPYALDRKDREAVRCSASQIEGGTEGRTKVASVTLKRASRFIFDYVKYNLQWGTSCPRAYAFLTIDPYGNLVPCRWTDKCSLGNVRNQPFHEIYNGPKRRDFLTSCSANPLAACQCCDRTWLWWSYLRLAGRESWLKHQ